MADSLIYETSHLITEDYPPGNGQDVLLRYGDRIVEVRSGRNGDREWLGSVTWLSHARHMLVTRPPQINSQYVHGLNAYQIDELLRKDDSVTLTVTPRTRAS